MFKNIFILFFLVVISFSGLYIYENLYKKQSDLDNILIFLSKNEKVKKDIISYRLKNDDYKALAMVLDDYGYYAYWSTSGMHTQSAANNLALRLCEKRRKSVGIKKECKVYNEVLTNLH